MSTSILSCAPEEDHSAENVTVFVRSLFSGAFLFISYLSFVFASVSRTLAVIWARAHDEQIKLKADSL